MDQPLLNTNHKSKDVTPPLTIFSTCCGLLTCAMLLSGLISYITFIANENWYLNAAQTNCKILDTKITKEYCSDGEGGGNDCYNGHVLYSYTVNHKKYHHDEIMVRRELYQSTVRKILDQDYPIGAKRACWYEMKNPKDITLIEENNYPNYQAAIIFTIIGASSCFLCVLSCGFLIYINRG